MTPHPTPFADLNAVLDALVAANRALLAGNFVGAYLHGSFAVGDADEASDVDYMIVVDHEIAEDEVADFEALQARVYQLDSNWARHLEGSYITRSALRRYDPASAPLLYFDNGSIVAERSQHDNNLVVRWQLRERGIILAGPAIRGLVEPVPAADLRREVLAAMRGRSGDWLAKPENIGNRFYQPFAVLTFCRMLHTLATGTIVSKPAAARWAQQHLESRWTELIQRAVDERPEPSLRGRTPADPAAVKQTLEFIRYALEKSGAYDVAAPPGSQAPAARTASQAK
jgi:predicted nucleotidyltransferase